MIKSTLKHYVPPDMRHFNTRSVRGIESCSLNLFMIFATYDFMYDFGHFLLQRICASACVAFSTFDSVESFDMIISHNMGSAYALRFDLDTRFLPSLYIAFSVYRWRNSKYSVEDAEEEDVFTTI